MQTNIFIGFQHEYSQICLSKYLMLKNNYLYEGMGASFFENKIQKLHCCESVNKYIDLPAKSIWFRNFSELNLNTQNNICFIFSKSQSWLLHYKDGMYIRQLKKNYPNSKIILYLWDLISTYYEFDISFFKKNCDAIFTYDSGDAKQYSLIYCPLPYSSIIVTDNPQIKEMDIYFCGAAKNRLQDLYHIYDLLCERNLRCCFRITGVPKKQQRMEKGIIYNKPISYYENLQYVQKAGCLLDVIQKNSNGETLRVKEAIAYRKKLLTNNSQIKFRNFYNENQISIFDDYNNINLDFLQRKNPTYGEVEFSNLEELLEGLFIGV